MACDHETARVRAVKNFSETRSASRLHLSRRETPNGVGRKHAIEGWGSRPGLGCHRAGYDRISFAARVDEAEKSCPTGPEIRGLSAYREDKMAQFGNFNGRDIYNRSVATEPTTRREILKRAGIVVAYGAGTVATCALPFSQVRARKSDYDFAEQEMAPYVEVFKQNNVAGIQSVSGNAYRVLFFTTITTLEIRTGLVVTQNKGEQPRWQRGTVSLFSLFAISSEYSKRGIEAAELSKLSVSGKYSIHAYVKPTSDVTKFSAGLQELSIKSRKARNGVVEISVPAFRTLLGDALMQVFVDRIGPLPASA